jgi:hypothetical protein
MKEKKNITVTLDNEVSAWVKVWSAQHGLSTSRMIAQLLEEKMKEDDIYEKAKRVALGIPPSKLRKSASSKLPKRKDLYE